MEENTSRNSLMIGQAKPFRAEKLPPAVARVVPPVLSAEVTEIFGKGVLP
jgi:hypothetical protein